MEKHEKLIYALITLLFLIIIVPKLSSWLSPFYFFGSVSINDLVLILITLLVFIGLFWLFYLAPDLGNSRSRFKRFYKPNSDFERVRDYIADRTKQGDNPGIIIHNLRKVGWDDGLINDAYENMQKGKTFDFKAIKKRLKRRR